jgi:hypothetical protein
MPAEGDPVAETSTNQFFVFYMYFKDVMGSV